MKHALYGLFPLALVASVLPVLVPQALAFPYRAELAGSQVWSERPIDRAALARVMARRNALVSASPLAMGTEGRRIFLTDGSWRWRWLTLFSSGSFAISRRMTENIVVNSSDIVRDTATNGAPIGGRRHLSSVLAHETTHGMLRRHYGIWTDMTPQWLLEGYCDYVAQESSLNAKQVVDLEARAIAHPALPYFYGRQRVAHLLEQNGGSVDELFSSRQR